MEKQIYLPLETEVIEELRAGDYVKLTGTIYTARDAAHKGTSETLDRGDELPINIEGTVVDAMGPSPAERRPPYWVSRSYYGQPDGQIRT